MWSLALPKLQSHLSYAPQALDRLAWSVNNSESERPHRITSCLSGAHGKTTSETPSSSSIAGVGTISPPLTNVNHQLRSLPQQMKCAGTLLFCAFNISPHLTRLGMENNGDISSL